MKKALLGVIAAMVVTFGATLAVLVFATLEAEVTVALVAIAGTIAGGIAPLSIKIVDKIT